MIKGRYVATLIIDLCIPDDAYETDTGLLPPDKLRDMMRDKLTPELKELLEDELKTQYTTLQVVQQLADVYEVPEEKEE